jgi:hypothetical protein
MLLLRWRDLPFWIPFGIMPLAHNKEWHQGLVDWVRVCRFALCHYRKERDPKLVSSSSSKVLTVENDASLFNV